MNQERLEEVRHQQDDKVVALQEADEQHLRQLTAWLERLDGWVRELEQRQARGFSHVSETQREHAAHLGELDRRDVQVLDALSITLHEQLEKLKAEQIEQGRGSAGKAG
jgi:hypothetical protein